MVMASGIPSSGDPRNDSDRHGLQQVHAGLMLQGEVAFQLGQNISFSLRTCGAVEQVAGEEEGQRAAMRPSMGLGVRQVRDDPARPIRIIVRTVTSACMARWTAPWTSRWPVCAPTSCRRLQRPEQLVVENSSKQGCNPLLSLRHGASRASFLNDMRIEGILESELPSAQSDPQGREERWNRRWNDPTAG